MTEKSTNNAAERVSDVVERAAGLSDEVLKSVESGGRAAIEAMRKFVDTVDEVLPAPGDRPTKRKTIVDAALDMADQLVTSHSKFLRSVVLSAEGALSVSDEEKK